MFKTATPKLSDKHAKVLKQVQSKAFGMIFRLVSGPLIVAIILLSVLVYAVLNGSLSDYYTYIDNKLRKRENSAWLTHRVRVYLLCLILGIIFAITIYLTVRSSRLMAQQMIRMMKELQPVLLDIQKDMRSW